MLCRIAAHQQKHSTTQAAVQMRTSGEVAPLHPAVVTTVEALPPVHELPPVVLPSSAAALKKSASSGTALHGRLEQKVQEASVSKPFPPLATPAVLHQHRPQEASASSAAAVSAGQAVAAAHLKQQLGGAAYILTGVQQHSYLAAQFSVQCCVSVWSLGNSNKTVYTQASN